MAEAILKHKASERYDVKSAGLFAMDGQPTHPNAISVLRDHDIQFKHSSKQLTKELVDWADLILTMTQGHKHTLIQHFPEALDKVETLKGYLEFQEQWEKWKEAKADYELKKAIYDHTGPTDEGSEKELENAYTRVQQFENVLGNLDIEDPFGASKQVYNDVFLELEELIDRFIENDV